MFMCNFEPYDSVMSDLVMLKALLVSNSVILKFELNFVDWVGIIHLT